MYWRKLKRKAFLLAVAGAFLMFLLIGEREKGEDKTEFSEETGERLQIPESSSEEEGEDGETEEPTAYTFPSADARIRVLLLGEDGSIYHKEKETDREYPGKLQYYEEKEGWVIVNEVPLEEYLRLVVPSEMPSTYAQEALKAQAVCARTYAVWQMQEYSYPEYQAHVDDSVSYQVYNNADSRESTDLAVEATAGQILVYDGSPVKAYYFSTSCGLTTDENIWEKGDREQTPYIAGRRVNESAKMKDYEEEEVFASFIRKKHAGDLEVGEPWYRWSCYVSLEQIRKNVDTWMQARLSHTEDGILQKEGDTYTVPTAGSIGAIRSAEITGRNTGGSVQQLILTGEEGTLQIRYEYNIRLMLGVPGGKILKNDGTQAEGSTLLPSGYFMLEAVEQQGKTAGYQIYGGGLGHGAGMSQNGARILAEQGSSCEEILQYFYQGVQLARLE